MDTDQSIMTNHLFLRTDYAAISDALTPLHNRIMKVVSNDEIKKCGRDLGLLKHKTLVFNNDNETAALCDYIVYSYRPNGFNMAEKYLRLHKSRLDDSEIELLSRMSKARYSVVSLDEKGKNNEVSAKDLFQKQSITLVDQFISETAYSGAILAGHFIHFDGFSMQSGGVIEIDRKLMMSPTVEKVLDNIIGNDDDDVALTQDKTAKIARATIAAAIQLGYYAEKPIE